MKNFKTFLDGLSAAHAAVKSRLSQPKSPMAATAALQSSYAPSRSPTALSAQKLRCNPSRLRPGVFGVFGCLTHRTHHPPHLLIPGVQFLESTS